MRVFAQSFDFCMELALNLLCLTPNKFGYIFCNLDFIHPCIVL